MNLRCEMENYLKSKSTASDNRSGHMVNNNRSVNEFGKDTLNFGYVGLSFPRSDWLHVLHETT